MARPKTILIAEDSQVQGSALKHMLETEGFNVLWALDGQAAITMAAIHLPDAIVMDIEMPNMTGLEACLHLKENFVTQEIPVVLLTSKEDLDTVDEALNCGAADFIPKDELSGPALLNSLAALQETGPDANDED